MPPAFGLGAFFFVGTKVGRITADNAAILMEYGFTNPTASSKHNAQ